MESFSGKELKFILDNEICRIATAKNNIPHVVPVCSIYKNNNIFFASDYKTKKYQNLLKNKRISVIIDLYDKKNGNKGIHLDGIASIIESGKELRSFYNVSQ